MAGRTAKNAGQRAGGTKQSSTQEAQAVQTPSETQAVQTGPIDFQVRIHSIRPNDTIKGTASVNINGAFAIRGVKIVEGSNGLFVSMPSYRAGTEYKDICFPVTQECREQLNRAVIGAYEQAVTQGQNSVAKHHEQQESQGQQAPEGQPVVMMGM